MSKTFFIDTTRCTACRGCQVACKEWQGFEGNQTKQVGWGSHQNPPDLNPKNYKVVRFSEQKLKDRVAWNFFPDQCRHCVDPSCKYPADEYKKGMVVLDDETGAVIYTDTCRDMPKDVFQQMLDFCPYNIPRRDEKTGVINKCDMCVDRVKAGMVPMCVKTCITGAMNFGEREDMIDLAKKRLGIVKKEFSDAQLVDEEAVRVIYLLAYKPDMYFKTAAAKPGTFDVTRKEALAKMGQSFRNFFRV